MVALYKQKKNVLEEVEGEEEMCALDIDLEKLLLGIDSKENRNDEDLQFHDSDYDFSNESDGDKVHINQAERAMVAVTGEPTR